MNKQLVYGIIVLFGLLLVWVVNIRQNTLTVSNRSENHAEIRTEIKVKTEKNNSSAQNPVLVDGKIAPQLTDLFPDREEGPHQKFVDEKSCLKCHAQEINIPGLGTAPKIPHEYRPNCISCHYLPSAGT